MFGGQIWHMRCRKLSQSYAMIMTALEHLHSPLPITKAVKTLTNRQSKLCVADISLCWEESICVYERREKIY